VSVGPADGMARALAEGMASGLSRHAGRLCRPVR